MYQGTKISSNKGKKNYNFLSVYKQISSICITRTFLPCLKYLQLFQKFSEKIQLRKFSWSKALNSSVFIISSKNVNLAFVKILVPSQPRKWQLSSDIKLIHTCWNKNDYFKIVKNLVFSTGKFFKGTEVKYLDWTLNLSMMMYKVLNFFSNLR